MPLYMYLLLYGRSVSVGVPFTLHPVEDSGASGLDDILTKSGGTQGVRGAKMKETHDKGSITRRRQSFYRYMSETDRIVSCIDVQTKSRVSDNRLLVCDSGKHLV